jgi:hypothetical protein
VLEKKQTNQFLAVFDIGKGISGLKSRKTGWPLQ